MKFTDETLQKALQAVGSIEQAAQELKQSMLVGGATQKDQVSGKANLGFEHVTTDTETGEAWQVKTYNDAEMHTYNKKLVMASELSERQKALDYDVATKEIQLAKKQHDFNMQQKYDNLGLRVAEQAEIVKTMLNVEYAKFNNATSEPIAPNTATRGDNPDGDNA